MSEVITFPQSGRAQDAERTVLPSIESKTNSKTGEVVQAKRGNSTILGILIGRKIIEGELWWMVMLAGEVEMIGDDAGALSGTAIRDREITVNVTQLLEQMDNAK